MQHGLFHFLRCSYRFYAVILTLNKAKGKNPRILLVSV